MSNIETGGPAFPILAEQAADGWAHCGMTLRDYFAAKAMQAFINGYVSIKQDMNSNEFCEASYEWADAMLEARK